MRAGQVHLALTEGDTFRRVFRWKCRATPRAEALPHDLTGWTARAQVNIARRPPITFSTEPGADGRITLGGDTGEIELLATAEALAGPRAGEGNWWLELTSPDGEVRTIIEGGATVRGK
jgi:hypothetical protein